MTAQGSAQGRLDAHLRRRERWRWPEIVFWLVILAAIFAAPSRDALINEILVAGLFALSLDLILGLAGIVSLGQAAFLGLGAYSRRSCQAGFNDPLLGLRSAPCRRASGLVDCAAPPARLGPDPPYGDARNSLMLGELANRASWLTGGADGLNFSMGKLLGLFPLGFTGQRNAALYSYVVLFVLFALARRLAQSPFGLALAAIRENRPRAGALGVATGRPDRRIYTCRGLCRRGRGAARPDDEIISLDLFNFHRSADVMLMLIIVDAGWLYGGHRRGGLHHSQGRHLARPPPNIGDPGSAQFSLRSFYRPRAALAGPASRCSTPPRLRGRQSVGAPLSRRAPHPAVSPR